MYRSVTRLFSIAVCVLSAQTNADDIHVAAASSLINVLDEIANQFQQEKQHIIKISYGSSGALVNQIIQGAPFELFMSADETYVTLLTDNQLTDSSGSVYGIGRLVLFVPEGSAVKPSADLSTLVKGVQDGTLNRLAIANPEHAPYGIIAKQALQRAQVWDAVQACLVFGKSASQATQFAMSGAADAALIPYSLALIPEVSKKGGYIQVSEKLYEPLKKRVVLMKNAGTAAREFYDHILGEKARAVFEYHGIGLVSTSTYRTADIEH